MAITRRKLFNYLIPSSIATLISSKKAFSSNEPDLVNSLKNQSSNMKIEESFKKIDSRLDDIEKRVFKSKFDNSSKFNIPTDYPGLQEAIDDLYSKTLGTKEYVVINIESGFQLSSGLKVEHGDFSRFYLQSDDHIVEVADNFVGVFGPDGKKTITDGTVILAYHARGPVLGCIIDGRHIARTLYFALGGSNGWSDRLQSSTEEKANKKKISGGMNFLHATFLAQEGSVLVCENTLAINCHLNSIYCERNSIIHAEFSDVSNSRQGGVVVTRGGVVNADSVNANGCTVGFWAHREGVISASDSHANNCKGNGYRADTGGRINAHNSSASNTTNSVIENWDFGGVGYLAFRGGEIICTGKSKAVNCVYGLMAIYGAKIVAFQITARNCTTNAILAKDGSQIEATEANISDTHLIAVHALDGSSVTLRAAKINNSGVYAIFSEFGSHISAREIQIKSAGDACVYSKSGSKIDINNAKIIGGRFFDLQINEGGCITANKSTYKNANNEVNMITGDGVIYK
ncbi:hypothetical protein [Rahnella aceris]|jgi:hypothetical protein|uniref:hypothetical protein n=1 Tax=Rahnella sp. (strain Y9602) TaxID=2703885 RepID=UPI000F18391E|nr:hypothetical protein BJ925_1692 [Rahnella aquatilis]